MLIPENILYHTVRSLFAFIEKDWKDNENKEKTILYDLLKKDDNGMELKIHRFDYYEQAQHIFLQPAGSSRKLQVNMGYNVQRAGLPTIHIMLPNEDKDEIGLGMGEGYQEYERDEEAGTYKRNFTGVWKSTYSLMITSDNSSEVVLIYHVLKNLFVATFEAFELRGLRDVTFGGQDLQFSNELVPPEVFHRNLTVNCFYESTVNELLSNKLIRGILTEGHPVTLDGDISSELKSNV